MRAILRRYQRQEHSNLDKINVMKSAPEMHADSAYLQRFAKRYIWWMAPPEAARDPHRVIAQVMNLGLFEDVMDLRSLTGDDALRRTIAEARPGEFSERSWHYWHQILNICDGNQIPPLPVRTYG